MGIKVSENALILLNSKRRFLKMPLIISIRGFLSAFKWIYLKKRPKQILKRSKSLILVALSQRLVRY